MNDSVTTNETPVSADTASNGGTAAQAAAPLRKLLRAKMAAVLQSHPKLLSTQAAKVRASKAAERRHKQFLELPLTATEDENKVREYLATSNDCYFAYCADVEAERQAKETLDEAQVDWYRATKELSEACTNAGGNGALVDDDVYLAALHLLVKAPVPKELPNGAPALVAAVELEVTAEQLALLDKLALAAYSAAKVSALAFKTGPLIEAAFQGVRVTRDPDTKEPVRPTEEEIQRYLRELELAVESRQNAHWELERLLAVRQTLIDEVTAGTRVLTDEIGKVNAIPNGDTSVKVKTALATAKQVSKMLTRALSVVSANQPEHAGELCLLRKPVASRRETRQVDELRKMIRQLAIIMAHLNESVTAIKAARSVGAVEVTLTGVAAACTTWLECLAWRVRKDEEQQVADRKNESRNSKIELLTEAVDRYERDRKDAAKELRRYIVSLMPPEDRPPCDELRKVLNMGAHMTTPERDHGASRRTGDFPVY